MAGLYGDTGMLEDDPRYGARVGPPAGMDMSMLNTPQPQLNLVDPKMMAYGAAMQNISSILGGRQGTANIGGAYMQGKQYNDSLRQNKAALARQAEQDERQDRQDAIMEKYREGQIRKLDAEAAAKSGGGFQGTGMEAQALNSFLNQFPPDQRDAIKNDLVRQRLSRVTTTVTPEGTFTQPGYDVSGYQVAPQPIQQPVPEAQPAAVSPPPIDTPPAFTPKPLTGEQAKASGFYERMISSQGEIDRILEASPDFDPTDMGEYLSESLPLVGNMMISKERQQYKQASKDWIRAKLRRESGAVIGEEEAAEEYRTYFPMPGDSKEVIAQKRRARGTAESAMESAVGATQKKKKVLRFNVETGKIE